MPLTPEHRQKLSRIARSNWQRWREQGAIPEARPGTRPRPHLKLVPKLARPRRAPETVDPATAPLLLWLTEQRLAFLDWRRPGVWRRQIRFGKGWPDNG